MTTTLFILNDGPYGSERAYNALRLAGALVGREHQAVRVFLLGNAVGCAGQGKAVSVDVVTRDIPPRPAAMDAMVRANRRLAA